MEKSYSIKKVWMGRVPEGADLQAFFDDWMRDHNVMAATVQVIGAMRSLAFAWFNHETQLYVETRLPGDYEITWCGGTVSRREGKAFVHLHITATDALGMPRGGHVLPGNKMFLGEFTIFELDGEPMDRVLDPRSGMYFWP